MPAGRGLFVSVAVPAAAPLSLSFMQRRHFLTGAAGLAALPFATGAAAAPAGLIDTNVSLGDWPVRRSWVGRPADLVAKLRRHGVTSAWTAAFEGVLQTDVAGANARLAAACAQEGAGVLVPFGTVNPTLPDWEDDLRRCREVHRMPGVRLYPNYQGYTLDDPRFARLLEVATRLGLLVQIAVTLEDDRSQNPILTAAPVQPAPLADVLEKVRGARVMLLNGTSRLYGGAIPLVQRLNRQGALFEIATLEGTAGIEGLLQKVPDLRLCFGSHTPYFYFEAALLKLAESELSAAQLEAIRHAHARAALS